MMKYEEMRLAVKQGAYWLDNTNPDWALKIDLSDLHMAKCDQCVLGQAVIGGYWAGVEEGSGALSMSDEASQWATNHGFDIDYVTITNEYVAYDCDTESGISKEADNMYSVLEGFWAEEVKGRRELDAT